MSVTYKLIKEYPGSPELNSVFEYWTDGISEQIYNGKKFVPLKIVKDYPEFWEEIVEKDYEILSFIATKKHGKEGFILTVEEIGKIKTNSNVPHYFELQRYLDNESGFWNIYSVKRLSDGEIFTVGDRVTDTCFTNTARHNLEENEKYDNVITRIAIVKSTHSEVAGYGRQDLKDTLMFSASNKYGNLNLTLKDAVKDKKPLYTTDDGVEVYEGDRVWSVNKQSNTLYSRNGGILGVLSGRNPDYAYFSTYKAAENYILKNKKCLSVEDIMSIAKPYTKKVGMHEYLKGTFKFKAKDLEDLVKENVKIQSL